MTKMLLALLLSAAPALAQEPEPPKKWTDTAEGSLVTTNGNTKTQTLAAKNLFALNFDKLTSLELEGGALNSKSQGQLIAESFYAGEKVARKWDERDYGFERYRWDRNVFAGFRHRHEYSLGAGREFWKADKDQLFGEAGPSYVIEERINDKRKHYGAARLYGKYLHDFSASVKFSQTAEFIQSVENKSDNRLTTETSFVSTLTSVFSLKTSFLWQHVGAPPQPKVRDDTTTSVAIIANF